MAKLKRQDTTIGNGLGNPILADGASTAGGSKPSQPDTGKEQNGTKPLTIAESLSLWQTACFDLQSYGFKAAILARDNRVFMILQPPASIGKLTFEAGHLKIDGVPVSEISG